MKKPFAPPALRVEATLGGLTLQAAISGADTCLDCQLTTTTTTFDDPLPPPPPPPAPTYPTGKNAQ